MEQQASPRVLIVGAGPAGLSLAIELGQRGIACLVIERNDRVGYAPRAKTTNVRTREHLRRWGIADRLRAASPLGVDYPSNVVFCTRLAGVELARHENAMYCAPGRNPLYSEHAQWIPQYTVEGVLRDHAQSLPGVQIRYCCELLDLSQDADGVRARLRDLSGGAESSVRADYLVGADGARSRVRDLIGTRMLGEYGLSRNRNIVFSAPGLDRAHRHGPAIMYWQVNRDAPSLIGPMDRGDTWFFMPTHVDAARQAGVADERALIARATGIDLPYQVLSSDEWVASKLLGDRYRKGRVFLAGDACHLHPPFGGYGMNMGIADSVDLGWKLAAVLQGWAGPGLLDSYEAERRPVHQWVMDEAERNHAVLGNQLLADGIGMTANAGNGSGARSAAASRPPRCASSRPWAWCWATSTRIPRDRGGVRPASGQGLHQLRADLQAGRAGPACLAARRQLLYDHFGQGYTLLAASASLDDIAAARADARRAGVPLTVIQPAEGAIASLYPARLTLIRPDQHVAWRGDAWPGEGVLARACALSLHPQRGA